ncbi:MAG: response regulator [Spartobacteria bacterium]|nr:response regulator [Spartobacteria bacterium]
MNKETVLVVDDDITIREMANYYLTNAGFDVVTLEDGSRVNETLRERCPHAVLLDVLLPDSSGFDICRAIRSMPEAEFIPVVMLTSLNDEEAIRIAFEAGATAFSVKPVNWLNETYRLRYLLRAAKAMNTLNTACEDVARSKEAWQRTFDSTSDAIILMDPQLHIRQANAAALKMVNQNAEMVATAFCSDIYHCCKDNSECIARRVLNSGVPETIELKSFGEHHLTCLVTVAPVKDATGKIEGLIHTVKDITAYRELEKEYLHAQKMEAMGVLASGIAHDFNNMLQSMMGLTELLELMDQGIQTAEERDFALNQMKSVIMKGRGLTQQLLCSSRKTSMELKAVDVSVILHGVQEILQHTLPKMIRLEMSSDKHLRPAKADAAHLHQVLMNLAINAMHAMPDGGTLRITAENLVKNDDHDGIAAGLYTLITVTDTGCGMSERVQSRIFEPFYTTKTEGNGTGLGLSVAYGIIRDHSGHIRCKSKPGAGTTFQLYIPIYEKPHAVAAEPKKGPQPNRPHKSAQGELILIADDAEIILETAVRFFTSDGYQVLKATDGVEALELYKQYKNKISTIILDMNMPNMDGETCLHNLAEMNCTVPTIIATGALLSAQHKKELLQYAREIIAKPYSHNTLMEAIHRITDQKPQ